MTTDGPQERHTQAKLQRTPHPNSLAHLSGCSSVALWLVVGIVGTYILYGVLVWLTSTTPISALR